MILKYICINLCPQCHLNITVDCFRFLTAAPSLLAGCFNPMVTRLVKIGSLQLKTHNMLRACYKMATYLFVYNSLPTVFSRYKSLQVFSVGRCQGNLDTSRRYNTLKGILDHLISMLWGHYKINSLSMIGPPKKTHVLYCFPSTCSNHQYVFLMPRISSTAPSFPGAEIQPPDGLRTSN